MATLARHVRVPDDRWDAFLAEARRRGTTGSAVLNHAIEAYLSESAGPSANSPDEPATS